MSDKIVPRVNLKTNFFPQGKEHYMAINHGLGHAIHCFLKLAARRVPKSEDDEDAIESHQNFMNRMAQNIYYVVRNMAAIKGEFYLMSGIQMKDFGERHEKKLMCLRDNKKWPEKEHVKHAKTAALMASDSFEEVIFFNLGFNRFVIDVDCPLDIPVDLDIVKEYYGESYEKQIIPELKEILDSGVWKHFKKIDKKVAKGSIKKSYALGLPLLACIITSMKKALMCMDIVNQSCIEVEGPLVPEFVIKASIFDNELFMTTDFPKWSFHILTKTTLSSSKQLSHMFGLLVIFFMMAAYLHADVPIDALTEYNIPQDYDTMYDILVRFSRKKHTKESYDQAKFFYSIIDLGLYAESHNLRLTYSTKPDKGIHTEVITKGHTFMDSVVRPYFDTEDDVRFYKILVNNRISNTSTRPKKEFCIESIEDDFIRKSVNAACIRFPEFSFRDITVDEEMQLVNFDRKSASTKECPFCKSGRKHTNDNNLFMVVNKTASGRFAACYCRKAKETRGVNASGICVYSEVTDTNSFEARINSTLGKISKNQFFGLYQDDLPGRFEDNFDEYIEEDHKKITELSFDNDIIFVQASTGLGKTKAVGNYINGLKKTDQVLAVSFRVALSFNLLDAFNKIIETTNKFDHYRNSRDRISEFNKMIVQVESFYRIDPKAIKDNLTLVLDESESIISQLYSGLSDRQSDNLKMFIYLVGRAKKVIAIDAYMTVRTINVINYIKKFYRASVKTTMYRNIYKSHKDTRYFLSKDRSDWLGCLCAYLKNDRKCVVAVNSKKDSQIIHNAIKDIVKKPINIGIYSSDTSETIKKEHFQDVNNYWDKYDLLIYTPTAGAGISFEKEHYDYLFGFFTNSSCDAESCLQMLARVRNIKHKMAYIYIDPMMTARPLTRDEIFTSVIRDHETNMSYISPDYYLDLEGRKMVMDSPESEIAMTNLMMRNRSQADFVGRFTSILAAYATNILIYESGFTRVEYEKYREETSIKNAEILVAARQLTKKEYADLCEKSSLGGDISTDEKISMEKYGLCKLFNVRQDTVNDSTFKDYNKSLKKTQFANLCTVPDVHDLKYSVERMKVVLGTAEMNKLRRLHGELFKENKFTNCSKVICILQLLSDIGINNISGNSLFSLREIYKKLTTGNKFNKEHVKLLTKIYDDNKIKGPLRPPTENVTYELFKDFFKKFFVEACRIVFGMSVKYASDDTGIISHNSRFVYQKDIKDRELSDSYIPKVMAFGYLDRIYERNYLKYGRLETEDRVEVYEDLCDPIDE